MIEWLAGWPGALWLQASGTAYLLVNASHILGIGLVLGAMLPLDLRLLGLFRAVPLAVLGPFLSRTAAAGIALALPTGFWLFSVRPAHYLDNTAFRWKMLLLALALGNVALQHGSGSFRRAQLGGPVPAATQAFAFASVCSWLSVLVAGRWIGFL